MEFPSDYLQIIVAVIYAMALFYAIATFRRSKKLDQITSLGDVMKEIREIEQEMAKIPPGPQYDEVRKSWYSRMFNSLEWLSFLINKKIMTDKKLIEYIKPMIITYYDNTFLKYASTNRSDSDNYPQFKKLYQSVKNKPK
ncbi:MAG: hypothetical protein AB7V56_03735 [Candidatus Nitrosocosmicus sp.]|jgi:hypothetical protein|nr:hypothetical protein [Candidatus Nitrosocosmicus sp.]